MSRLPAETEARESLLRAFALRVERDRERAVVEIGPLPPAATAAATPALGGYLIDARPLKDLKGRLVLSFASTADDYAGRVEIRGSDDLVFWRPLASGPLTRSRRLGEIIERNHFAINRPPAFIRVAWTSKDAPDIERAAVSRRCAASVTLPRAQLAATLSDDRRTLYVDVPEALPITRVLVRVPELNRVVRAQVYRHDAAPSPRVRRHPCRTAPHRGALATDRVGRGVSRAARRRRNRRRAAGDSGSHRSTAVRLFGTARWRSAVDRSRMAPGRVSYLPRAHRHPMCWRWVVSTRRSGPDSMRVRCSLPTILLVSRLPVATVEVGGAAHATAAACAAHCERSALVSIFALGSVDTRSRRARLDGVAHVGSAAADRDASGRRTLSRRRSQSTK